MNWLPLDSNGWMAVLFLIFLAALGLAMKLAAVLIRNDPASRSRRFWLSPLPAPNSLRRLRPPGELKPRLIQAAVSACVLALYYQAFWHWIAPLSPPAWIIGYLGVPVLLLFSSLFVGTLTVLWLPAEGLLPPLHDRPVLARGVADFWGRRWNLWFSDWFRHALFVPLRGRPVLAVVVVFFVSGLMHEWVVNAPLYLVNGRRLFGSMMVYFLLQAVGMLVERRWFAGKPAGKVALAWLVIFVPAPLLINEGLQRALQLWPY